MQQRKTMHTQTLANMRNEIKGSCHAPAEVPTSVLALHVRHCEAMRGVAGERFNQDTFFRFAMNTAVDVTQAVALVGATLLECAAALAPVRTRRSRPTPPPHRTPAVLVCTRAPPSPAVRR